MAGHSILVVDDEVSLVRLLTEYLSLAGYHVSSCHSGIEALRMLEEAPVDLAIIDLTLPDVSGTELVERVLGEYRDLLVLVCSGHFFSATTLPPEYRSRVGVLQKPFLPKMLSQEIGRLLNQRRA